MATKESPDKKKMKLSDSPMSEKENSLNTHCNMLKRPNANEASSSKKARSENTGPMLQALRRQNFVNACEQVSRKAFFDFNTRLQVAYLPPCVTPSPCRHQNQGKSSPLKEMPCYAEECVKIELKTNMWWDALEVCQLCITEDQYLSANVLKEIIEIMMNANEDSFADYDIPELIDKCQQTLSLNFNIHPPCVAKSLRKCYKTFLTSAMDPKEKTFSNRTQFSCDKGLVKYCMNRLEYEISCESCDSPFIDKNENIPEEMKQSVKGLHWQKEKLEIFELLERPERINRLMAVLESIVELLQFDLAIWQTRHCNNKGNHIMRSDRPLMAFILWSENILYTGAVNINCRQILKLFVYFIHLDYPEKHKQVMIHWLNVVIQTFYVCEHHYNMDYPNTGKYCSVFAREFYKIILEMPYDTILKILERIQPNFMQVQIGTIILQQLLLTQEDNIVKIFIDLLMKPKELHMFPEGQCEIRITKPLMIKPRKVDDLLKYLTKLCDRAEKKYAGIGDNVYRKIETNTDKSKNEIEIDQNYVLHVVYITMEAYLELYSIEQFQETFVKLNEKLSEETMEVEEVIESSPPEVCFYSVTEDFVKLYRSINKMLRELMSILHDMKQNRTLPKVMVIFENIGLLD